MTPVGPVTRLVRTSLVVVVALVVQTSLIADLEIAGAVGDVVLLTAIAAGIEGGPDRGAWYGFAAGLTFDLLLTTPVGLSALTYCMVAYFVGTVQATVLRATWWIPVLTAVTASALGVTLYVVLGRVVGQAFPFGEVPRVALVVAALNAGLVVPAARALRWALGADPRLGLVAR